MLSKLIQPKELWTLAEKILREELILSLATTDGHKPWCSSLFFIHDNELRLFWKSSSDSRHTRNIFNNPAVAITVNSTTIISSGVQAGGTVGLVKDINIILRLEVLLNTKRTAVNGKKHSGREVEREGDREWYCFTPKEFYLHYEPLLGYKRALLSLS